MSQISKLEMSALETIERSVDVSRIRTIARNAKGKSLVVEQSAIRRIATLESLGAPGSVEADCWSMVHTIEEIRRQLRGRKSPMNRLRPKIEREGAVAALEYLALNESDGFKEVLEYGLPEMTAEVIVLRHGEPTFSSTAVSLARARLENAGFDPEMLVKL